MAYFPIFIELKKCLVVGGGKVALRKIRVLKSFGAEITVVSPVFCDELTSIEGIILKTKYFDESDLIGQNMAFCAVDDIEVNDKIIQKCRENHILVNSALDGKMGDFAFPSVIKDDNFVIGISTSGKSPAFAKKIREKLLEILPSNLGEKLAQISKVRDAVLKNNMSPSECDEYQREIKNLEKLF